MAAFLNGKGRAGVLENSVSIERFGNWSIDNH